MRKWREVGSVGSINSREHSQNRSVRSRHDTPFQSFHQNIHNKSQRSLEAKDKTFCQQYMQRNKSHYHNLTMEMARSQKVSKKAEEDLFTEMRNGIKREPSLDSRVSSKSLSERQSKLDSGPSKLNKKERLEKTNSKLHGLKKQQNKLKKSMETETAAIKNIFYQLDEVFHRFNNKAEEKTSGQSSDPQLLRDIVTEAVSIERYFAQMDRKKQEIMHQLDA